jgi:hypothetical protein
LSSALPINQGGTGSATQNFVDLSSTQTVGGAKTFSSTITGDISGNASTVTTNANLTGDVTSSGNTTTLTSSSNVESVISANTTVAGALQKTSNLSDVSNATTARSNLSAGQWLAPTVVTTSAYSANPGDFVPVDTSSGNVTITLPNAPADKSKIGIKLINTAANNTVTINTSGSDVFNKVGNGVTSVNLIVLNQAVMLQYTLSSGIWYVQGDDLPQSSVYLGFQKTVTTTYGVSSTDHFVLADATSGAFTVTLPTAVGFTGVYNIDAITTTTNQVTVATTSSQTIDGNSTIPLGTQASGAIYVAITLMSDGANWRIV